MANSVQRKSNRKPTNRVFIWLAISSILAGILCFQIWHNIQQTKALQKSLNEAKENQTIAEVTKIDLQSQVDLLKTDDYVLKLARSRGFFSLPDEIIFNIPNENNLLKQEKVRQEALQKQIDKVEEN